MKKIKAIIAIVALILFLIILIVFPTIGIFKLAGITYSNWQSLFGFTLLVIIVDEIIELILRNTPPYLTGIKLYFLGNFLSLLIADMILTSVHISLLGIIFISVLFTVLEYLLDKYDK